MGQFAYTNQPYVQDGSYYMLRLLQLSLKLA